MDVRAIGAYVAALGALVALAAAVWMASAPIDGIEPVAGGGTRDVDCGSVLRPVDARVACTEARDGDRAAVLFVTGAAVVAGGLAVALARPAHTAIGLAQRAGARSLAGAVVMVFLAGLLLTSASPYAVDDCHALLPGAEATYPTDNVGDIQGDCLDAAQWGAVGGGALVAIVVTSMFWRRAFVGALSSEWRASGAGASAIAMSAAFLGVLLVNHLLRLR